MRRSMLTMGSAPPVMLGNPHTGVNNSGGASGYNMGWYWNTSSGASMLATGLSWYGSVPSSGEVKLGIWDGSGGYLLRDTASIFVTTASPMTRVKIPLTSPLTLTSSKSYMFTLYCSGSVNPFGGDNVPANTWRPGVGGTLIRNDIYTWYASGFNWPSASAGGYVHAEMYLYQ